MWMPGTYVNGDYGETILSMLARKSGVVVQSEDGKWDTSFEEWVSNATSFEEWVSNVPFFGAADPDGMLRKALGSAMECVADSVGDEANSGVQISAIVDGTQRRVARGRSNVASSSALAALIACGGATTV
jgi:hypothetical protein